MAIKLPKKIKDVSLVYSNVDSLSYYKTLNMAGKFEMVAVWDAKAEGYYYDCYFITITKETDRLFVSLQYQRTDPKGTLDVWAAPVLLRMPLSDFDLSQFIWQIKEHRVSKRITG